MIFYILLSVALPGVIGFFIVSLFLPTSNPRPSSLIMKSCLAGGIGLGVSSNLLFFWLLIFASHYNFTSFILMEIAFLVGVAAIFIYTSRRQKIASFALHQWSDPLTRNMDLLLSIFFFSAFASALFAFILMWLQSPHGNWDAYYIFNMRARFLFRGTDHWRETFSHLMDWTSHPDYPLLLSGIVARYWKYLGKDLPIVPGLISLFFVFTTIGLLASSLSTLKTKGAGYLAGLLLLGTNHYFLTAANQNADIPMSFYILATVLLFFVFDRLTSQNYILILAGITAGLVGWTKNEGLLFILALIVARFFVIVPFQGLKEFFKQVSLFALGLLPMALAIAYFKIYIAPANDIISTQSLAVIQGNAVIVNRFIDIIKKSLSLVASYVPLLIFIIYGLLVGIKKENLDNRSIPMFLILGFILFIGYFIIYILSPHNLNWHIKHSLGRLCLQLWPSILFVFFIITPSPEELINKKVFVG